MTAHTRAGATTKEESVSDTPPFTTSAYSQAGAGELTLDVFTPTSSSRHSAVLLFHGGGWRAGAKEAVHTRAAALAAQGFVGIAVQYRLLDAAPWPAPLADAAAALSWVRNRAQELAVDPARIAVQGHSAGAHIALMTGTLERQERPAAIVAFYPPVGFYLAEPPPPRPPGAPPGPPAAELDEHGQVPSWMLFPPGTADAELVAASPIAIADAAYPPTILFHGTADSAIATAASVALHQRLNELGVPSDLHIYAGRDHEFDRAPSMLAATVAATASFLDRMVIRQPEFDDEAEQFSFLRLIRAQAG